jgi:hypothetical protein
MNWGGKIMPDSRSESIIENQMLNRKIVYAINKAIADDVPQAIRENHLETNNRHIFAAGDYINDNLRKHVVKDEVELISFNRYAWEGRILVDRANHVTYTISTHQTLKTVIRKNRNRPHYLQSILFAENCDCEGTPKQLSMGDFYPEFVGTSFDKEELEEDYDKIMQASISKTDGYKHYIIAYTSDHHTIMDIEMLLLDKDFAEVDRLSLMEYVNPDFASLTESKYDESDSISENGEEVRPLKLKLKPGVKPALRAMEEEA